MKRQISIYIDDDLLGFMDYCISKSEFKTRNDMLSDIISRYLKKNYKDLWGEYQEYIESKRQAVKDELPEFLS